jgi:hypothetical protein
MKTCAKCGYEKELEDFSNRAGSSDGKQGYCKKCKSDYCRNYRRVRQNYINAIKNACCFKCGKKYLPKLMDFHHLDPCTKTFTVSDAVGRGAKFDIIKTEIDKCIVVCKPCHRDIHRGN